MNWLSSDVHGVRPYLAGYEDSSAVLAILER